ncbi:hypothetical protein [Pseudomonas farris]
MTAIQQNPSVKPGTPDPIFGTDGTVTLWDLVKGYPGFSVLHLFKGMSNDSEGKTIFSAQLHHNDHFVYALGRLNDDGQLDTTFANNGLSYGNFIANVGCAGGKLTVQKNESGKIYMLGWTEHSTTNGWADLVVACFDKNGKPDLTFADSGRRIIETPSDLELHLDSCSLHIQPDNKLLIATHYSKRTDPSHTTGVLLRLLPDGSLDNEFNGNGRWEFKLPDLPNASTAISVCVSQGQKIVIAGHAQFQTSKNTAVFARLNANGQIDASFGDLATPGFHVVQVAERTTQFNALVERSDGSLIGAGAASTAGKQVTAGLLVAVTSNGIPHRLFNNGKPLLTQFDETRDNGWATAFVQTDNRFVVASKQNWVFVARFQSDGKLDVTFNDEGYTALDSQIRNEPVLLTSRQDGRIIVSANVLGVAPEGIGLARCYFI